MERKQNEKRTVFAEIPRFARNRCILQETEQDLPGALQSPLHIPSSLAHSRRNAVRHVNIIHNARSITKRLGTSNGQTIELSVNLDDMSRRWELKPI